MKLGIGMLVAALVSIGYGLETWSELTNYPSGDEFTAWMALAGGLVGLGIGLAIGGIVRMIVSHRKKDAD